MGQKKVVIDVDLAEGTVAIEVNGVPGKMCELETRELAAALGGRVLEHRRTREYRMAPEQKVTVRH